MKEIMFLLPIETMIYLHNGPLVVMLIYGLVLLVSFMVLWISSTFLFDNWEKEFLIFKISLILLKEAWA